MPSDTRTDGTDREKRCVWCGLSKFGENRCVCDDPRYELQEQCSGCDEWTDPDKLWHPDDGDGLLCRDCAVATDGGTAERGAECIETIPMTDDGLVMPDELVGFTGRLVVEWPSDKMQEQIINLVDPGLPEVCEYICRGVMPSDTAANGVPGGHLRINGSLYKIEDQRSLQPGANQSGGSE